jgi:hypothetical protein
MIARRATGIGGGTVRNLVRTFGCVTSFFTAQPAGNQEVRQRRIGNICSFGCQQHGPEFGHGDVATLFNLPQNKGAMQMQLAPPSATTQARINNPLSPAAISSS